MKICFRLVLLGQFGHPDFCKRYILVYFYYLLVRAVVARGMYEFPYFFKSVLVFNVLCLLIL